MTSEDSITIDPERLDYMRRLSVILDGQDPDAQQTLNEFLKFKNPIERTNLPTMREVLAIAQITGFGKTFYPDDKNDPFTMVAERIAEACMARKGEKSNQFVELMKQTPSLTDLQTLSGESQKRGLMDRIFGRGKSEE